MQISSQISSLWQEKRHFYLSKLDLSPLKLSSHLMAYHRLQNTHVNCAWARRRTMVSNSPNSPKIRSLDFKQIHMISIFGHRIHFIFKICQTVAGTIIIWPVNIPNFLNLILAFFANLAPFVQRYPMHWKFCDRDWALYAAVIIHLSFVFSMNS
jgi:hypothetical protein